MRNGAVSMAGGKSTTVWRRLKVAMLPGPAAARVRAAGSLPSWLCYMIAFATLYLIAEMLVWTFVAVESLDSLSPHQPDYLGMFYRMLFNKMQPHVALGILRSPEMILLALLVAVLFYAVLELIGSLLVAPFAASYGQALKPVQEVVRRFIFSLGSVWLLSSSFLCIGIFVLSGGLITVFMVRTGSTSYVYFQSLLLWVCWSILVGLILLMAWLLGLIKAASACVDPPRAPLPSRCGYCGYLLRGLPEGTGCPECGSSEPKAPDRQRKASYWVRRWQVGRLRAWWKTTVGVLLRPGCFFGKIEILSGRQDAVGLLRMCLLVSLFCSLPFWILVVIAFFEDIWHVESLATLLLSFVITGALALVELVLIGGVMNFLGYTINRLRQEPCWPIAANAGCYLAVLIPPILAAEALWFGIVIAVEERSQWRYFSWMVRQIERATGVDEKIVFVFTAILPLLGGLVLLARSAVGCYKNVRFACR